MTGTVIPLATVEATPAGYYFPITDRPATVLPDFDVETYSAAGFVWDYETEKWVAPPGIDAKKKGLPCVGVVVYSEHPSFEIQLLSYDLKDGKGRRQWRDGDPLPPQELIDYLRAGGVIEAHNAAFERRAWNAYAVKHWGAAPLQIEQQRCSMAKARAVGLPPSLDGAAEALGTTRKDPKGDSLIRVFSHPVKPTKRFPNTRILPSQDPARFSEYARYNEQDIIAEAHMSAHVPDLSPQEQEYWFLDQRINERGVAIDQETVEAACSILDQALRQYASAFRAITGLNPTQNAKVREWFNQRGYRLDNLQGDYLEERAATDPPDDPELKQALRSLLALGSSSVKKYYAMRASWSRRGRLHDLFVFHGAHTGRPTGYGVQPTNLPRSGPDAWLCQCGKYYGHTRPQCPWCGAGVLGRRNVKGAPIPPGGKPLEWTPEAMFDAIEVIRSGSLAMLEYYWGDALATLAGCLRGMFVAAPGHDLVSSDWTAIEAVVLACLAGEQWRIDLFRDKGKIYEKSGALVFGIPYEEVLEYANIHGHHHPARQTGKTAELGLGYRGWISAWRVFDKSGKLSDDDIKDIILKWRAASPAIVEFWGGQSRRQGRQLVWERYGVEGAFIDAALAPGQVFDCRGLKFQAFEQFGRLTVTITLLSGRRLTYNDVILYRSDRYGNEYDISFWYYNTNTQNGSKGWIQSYTHGGKLVENIVQAASNDILRAATVTCERRGYPIVLHVYDEIVAEVPADMGSVEELEAIMAQQLSWAYTLDGQPWPIGAAGGWRGRRYRKG